ncbi:MMPL family transporter [Micromonospora siamensis]|uniref:Putative drug exporter of the RND superfamily n=1 Tax=Micromonospora siamensis TaxID=299152 RepID=A0A1C5H798_9ACTN|nr:MMPL family transporter [Micromonospora siamensis]SCG41803.1 putative drug exporter of the RND superfamily [Micromonospora siamensis]
MDTSWLARLAAFCHRRRLTVVVGWLLIAVVSVLLAARWSGPTSDDFTTGPTSSGTAQRLVREHLPEFTADSITLAVRSTVPVDDPAVRDRVTRLVDELGRSPHVARVSSPYSGQGQVSADRHTAYAVAALAVPSGDLPVPETAKLLDRVHAATGDGVTFALSGRAVDAVETPGGGAADAVGLAVAMVVLLIAFGSVLAMVVPIVTAVVGIVVGLSALELLRNVLPTPGFAAVLATMIGLGVGIDYALFIVTRYREALAAGRTPAEAVVDATGTAGRAVLFAGGTVVVGLCGLLLTNLGFLRGLAVGSAATVAVTMAAAVTLLPALLGLLGHRIDRLSVHRRRESAQPLSARWACAVARRPVVATLLATLVLAGLAAPVLGMRLGTPDASTQPRDTSAYQAHRILADGFGDGFDATLSVVVRLPEGDPELIAGRIAGLPGVASVSPPRRSRDGAVAVLAVRPTTGTQDPATVELVHRLHRATEGQPAYVGGAAAATIDFAELTRDRLPVVIVVVVGVSLLLLMVVFRSVVLALKAGLLNLISIGASFGVLVAVVQWGWLGGLLNFPTAMPVTAWVPLIMFPILFGLSMDYEVFLVSRIREAYDATGDNRRAVREGLARSARVISAAAAIMIAVFLSVMLGADLGVKQLGLGLAVAVAVDATVVRLVLLPASMELLGRLNWWLPRWLDRVLPQVRLEDGPGARSVAAGDHHLHAAGRSA